MSRIKVKLFNPAVKAVLAVGSYYIQVDLSSQNAPNWPGTFQPHPLSLLFFWPTLLFQFLALKFLPPLEAHLLSSDWL
jgi:hypothetical protein